MKSIIRSKEFGDVKAYLQLRLVVGDIIEARYFYDELVTGHPKSKYLLRVVECRLVREIIDDNCKGDQIMVYETEKHTKNVF